MTWLNGDGAAGSSKQWQVRAAQVLVLAVLAGMGGRGVQAATDEVPRAYVMETPVEVVLNEPVIVTVVVANTTDRPWFVDWGGARNKEVRITAARAGEEGTEELSPQLSLEEENVTFGGPVEIVSGEESRRQLVLDSWFDFEAVGSYDVVVGVPVLERRTGNAVKVSASVTVQVAPPDLGSLARACDDLAENAIRGSSEAAHVAGEALSRVGDNVCLVAILRVLDNGFFAKQEAIEGLAEIGSEEAIEALVARWDDLRPGLRARALYEFRRRERLKQLEERLESQGCRTELPRLPDDWNGSEGCAVGMWSWGGKDEMTNRNMTSAVPWR